MKIEIRHRRTNAVLFTADVHDDDAYPMRSAARQAIAAGVDLRGANLSGADLSEANLRGANLSGADLSEANLRGANLCWADLCGADLREANLRVANLCGADLREANLRGANLCGVDLREANLRGVDLSEANLRGMDLSGADLRAIHEDMRAIFDAAPLEVAGVLAKLRAGEVDGTVYEGECACLVGTIANLRHCDVNRELPEAIAPNSSRPAERFFLGIPKGATPDTNPVAAVVDDWICEFLAERGEGPWIDE